MLCRLGKLKSFFVSTDKLFQNLMLLVVEPNVIAIIQ